MKLQKRLLIAGGGYADIPLILAAKKLGYYTITTGYFPDELGHRYSDEYCKADYSDLHSMLKLSRQLKIEAICACCNDFSALSSAYVAEKLGLPGHDPYETTKIIHHKDLYRKFASENNVLSLTAISLKSTTESIDNIKKLSLPLIIKPVDLTGGKGISTVYNFTQVLPALEKAFSASRAKRVVVEEFIK